MTKERSRPSLDGDERTQLLGWLELQRRIVVCKCEGLTEEQAHRAVLPSSPLLSLAGLVSHLRWVEHFWFEICFLGGPAAGPQFVDEPADAEWRVDDVPMARLLQEYEQQCQISDRIATEHELSDLAVHPDFDAASLRWLLAHMLEETARHAGHADIVRELLDGDRGYYRSGQV